MADEVRPWHRLPGEPMLWFGRFKAWVGIDPPARALVDVYKAERAAVVGHAKINHIRCAPPAWTQIKEKWQWEPRADAYDMHQLQQKEDADKKAESEYRHIREFLRREELKKQYSLADTLRNKAEALLALPLLEERIVYNVRGEEQEVNYVPDTRSVTAAVNALKEAKAHALRSLDLPDKIVQVAGRADAAPVIGGDSATGIDTASRFAYLLGLVKQLSTGGTSEQDTSRNEK